MPINNQPQQSNITPDESAAALSFATMLSENMLKQSTDMPVDMSQIPLDQNVMSMPNASQTLETAPGEEMSEETMNEPMEENEASESENEKESMDKEMEGKMKTMMKDMISEMMGEEKMKKMEEHMTKMESMMEKMESMMEKMKENA